MASIVEKVVGIVDKNEDNCLYSVEKSVEI